LPAKQYDIVLYGARVCCSVVVALGHLLGCVIVIIKASADHKCRVVIWNVGVLL